MNLAGRILFISWAVVVLLLVLGVFISGQDQARNLEGMMREVEGSEVSPAMQSRVLVIDGCEYLLLFSGQSVGDNFSFGITHKGTCSNHVELALSVGLGGEG